MSISAFINCTVLAGILIHKKLWVISLALLLFVARIMVACVAMAVGLLYFMPDLNWWFAAPWFMRVGFLSLLVIGGAVGYGLLLLLTGVRLRHILIPIPNITILSPTTP